PHPTTLTHSLLLPLSYETTLLPHSPHLFPTRRSSDLRMHHHSIDPVTTPTTTAAAPAGVLVEASPRAANSAAKDTMVMTLVMVRDRKSTRLNSSHVKISYAVFCLKKKKHVKL